MSKSECSERAIPKQSGVGGVDEVVVARNESGLKVSERRPGPSTKQLVGGLQSLMELTTLGRGCYAQRVRDEWIRLSPIP